MKAKKLNLEQALLLASIISKYVDIKTTRLDESAFDFIDDIIQKISAEEYLYCVSIMINKTEEYVKKIEATKILALFTEGLAVNKITTLLAFCENLK